MRSILNNIEILIRTGESNKARRVLSNYRSSSLTRTDRHDLAALARRAGLPLMTLRLLTPIVRPPAKQPMKASERERAEYAAALVRVGATTEAIEMLQGIDPSKTPQVHLYFAHALFTRWEYEAAVPFLEKYVDHAPDTYQRIIGKMNLASALVHERKISSAQAVLHDLEDETKREKLRALHGNTLERLAELAIDRGQWREAERYLTRAEADVDAAGGFDEFFVRKWRYISDLLQKKSHSAQRLLTLRTEAIQREHWETVRECDAYLARATNNVPLFHRVYFGTPYPSYRKRLLVDFGLSTRLPDSFDWCFEGELPPTRILDFLREPVVKAHPTIKLGQVKHRLLRVLTSDFYRPFRVANLFSEIYAGECFHIESSPARVHQGVKELKKWFLRHRIPLRLTEKSGGYRLVARGARIAITVPTPEWWERHALGGIERVRHSAGTRPFSTEDVVRWLRISRRSAANWLRLAIEKDRITKIGAGPQTRYCLKS